MSNNATIIFYYRNGFALPARLAKPLDLLHEPLLNQLPLNPGVDRP